MFNLIKADLYKMRKTKSIKILFLLSCISATLMSVISYQLTNVNLSHDIIGIGSFFTDFQMISLLVWYLFLYLYVMILTTKQSTIPYQLVTAEVLS